RGSKPADREHPQVAVEVGGAGEDDAVAARAHLLEPRRVGGVEIDVSAEIVWIEPRRPEQADEVAAEILERGAGEAALLSPGPGVAEGDVEVGQGDATVGGQQKIRGPSQRLPQHDGEAPG